MGLLFARTDSNLLHGFGAVLWRLLFVRPQKYGCRHRFDVTCPMILMPMLMFDRWMDQECKATDQKQTGRCWIFAALNVWRLGILEKYNLGDDFELVRHTHQSRRRN